MAGCCTGDRLPLLAVQAGPPLHNSGSHWSVKNNPGPVFQQSLERVPHALTQENINTAMGKRVGFGV